MNEGDRQNDKGEATPGRSDPLPYIRQVLGEALTAPTTWQHGDPSFAEVDGDFYDIWRRVPLGHKVYSYFKVYEKVFGPLRGRVKSVLEIGVYHGASLKTWREYFGSGTVIVGADINPACDKSNDPANGIHVRVGDQADPAFLADLISEFGPFDVIMDDGSHATDHQLSSFRAMFDQGLTAPGIYFIEDTCTAFWRDYQTGPSDPFDLAQACALGMNYFYQTYGYADYTDDRHPRPFSVPRITRMVEEVRIFDSAVAIYKAGDDYYPPLVKHL